MNGSTTTPDRTDAAVEAVLARLDTRQRIGQLNQRLFGWHCVRRTGPARAPRYELTDAFAEEVARWDGLGALYGLFRADAWSGRTWDDGILPEHAAEVAGQVVDAVRAASPTGTGPLLVEEAPHGHQALGGTLLPTNLALAAGWDPGLVEECAAAVARELRSAGVHIALVSALDLLRDPRWGRSEECFGESPLLAAELTAAVVRGMQGPDRERVADGTGLAVVLKHLAGQGEGTGGRNGHPAVIGPYDLAEIHLPPVEAGVAAGALGMMAAYNDIDGVPCCANPELLTTLLRDRWGFDGVVMADGHAVDRLVTMTGSEPAAAALSLASGVDLSLWDRSYARLEEAVEQDPTLLAAVETACRRVLRLKARLGLLDGAGHLRPTRDDRATVRLS
ncbi:glycoside hydrolase family 3 protein, partial [Desertihabitans aurantiacus]|uniref:glycoside hydrolase family 3 protein n=1 Tax=Desertihabitans aurantiacus TaxID=2282477 RepID=UPI0018E4EB59